MDISRVRKKLKGLRSKDSSEKKNEKDRTLEEEHKETVAMAEEVKSVEVSSAESSAEVEKKEEPIQDIDSDINSLEEIELIAFKISSEEYAVRLLEMQEIINYRKVTPVPRSPRYLKGVTFLRGKVLPVIDLNDRLELRGDGDDGKKIIVLSTSKNEPVGVIVSSFIRVLRFPEKEILQPPPTLSEKEKKFIKGVLRIGERFISVLNIEELVKMEVV